MIKIYSVLICLSVFLFLSVSACSDMQGSGQNQESKFERIQDIQDIKPEKPVKIKLKRNNDAEYSWELSGDDVDRVIETDGRLKRYTEEKKKEQD